MNIPTKRSAGKLEAIGRGAIRVVGVILIILALIGGSGLIYQSISEAKDQKRFPPPGQMVDVGGYRLHLYCTGQGTPLRYAAGALGGTPGCTRAAQSRTRDFALAQDSRTGPGLDRQGRQLEVVN